MRFTVFSPYRSTSAKYLALGLSVLPITPMKKSPGCLRSGVWSPMSEWSRLAHVLPTSEDVNLWDSWKDAGVGLVLGGQAGVIAIDVDTDDEKLISIIAKNLPPSGYKKRGEKGFTAFYYSHEAIATKRIKVNKRIVLEVLSTGTQTVLPPSIHPNGKPYRWITDDSLEDILSVNELPVITSQHIKKVSDALALIDSQKTSIADVVSSSRYLSAEKVKDLRRALGYIPADSYDDWINVGMALHSTGDGQAAYGLWSEWSQLSDKYDPVNQRLKWKSFRHDASHPISVASIFHWASEHGFSNNGQVDVADQSSEVRLFDACAHTIEPFPSSLLNPPGFLGAAVRHIVDSAPKEQPVFSINAVLCMMGSVLGRKVCSRTNVRPNIYLFSVGASGCGKDHPRKCVKRILIEAGAVDLLAGEEIASAQGLVESTRKVPSGLFQIDELGSWLEAFQNKNAGTHLTAIPTTLMKLFTSSDSVFTGTAYADQKQRPLERIYNPGICLHGTTTAETMYPALKSRHLLDGFLNRILVLNSDDDDPTHYTDRAVAPVPASLTRWVRSVLQSRGGSKQDDGDGDGDLLGLMPETAFTVEMDPSAHQCLDEFSSSVRLKINETRGSGVDVLWVRAWEYAVKISMIVACGCVDDIHSATVKKNHMQWAVGFVGYSIEQTGKMVKLKIADSRFEGMRNDCFEVIAKAGARGVTEREMGRSKSAFKKLSPSEKKSVMESLTVAGMVELVLIPSLSGRGSKRNAWVAVAQDVE